MRRATSSPRRVPVAEFEDLIVAAADLHGSFRQNDHRGRGLALGRARRRPAPECVGNHPGNRGSALHGIEQRPENLALSQQGLEAAILLGAFAGVFQYEIHTPIGVARRLLGSGSEVREAGFADEAVMFFEGLDSRVHQLSRSQFGERGRHRVEQVVGGDELHVGVAGPSNARNDPFERDHFRAV